MSNSNSKSIPNDAFFSDLFSKFNIAATYFSAEPYGSGHINDTYLVKTKPTLGQNHQNYQNHFDYIFQRINHKIFKNIPGLMDNIVRVTDHLRKKISLLPGMMPIKKH